MHLETEGEAALECVIGQHPLAETVNGVDVGAVDVAHRGLETPHQRLIDDASPAFPCGKQLARLGIGGDLGAGVSSVQVPPCGRHSSVTPIDNPGSLQRRGSPPARSESGPEAPRWRHG